MKQIQHWIDGGPTGGSSDRVGPVYNPATGEQTGEVLLGSAADVDRAVQTARKAFETWRFSSLTQRQNVMFAFRELVAARKLDLAKLLTAEHGKTIDDALGEVQRGLEVVEFACNIAHLLKGDYSEQVSTGVDTYTIRQPLGVVAGITPFNFPAMVPMWMYPIAIACGNTFVLKPSEQDPMTTMQLAELALEAGVPPGVLNVVHGGKEAVDALCSHPGVRAVSFVGSCHVGEHVYKLSSQHGKRAQCMMGAKNHAVVMPDANKERSLDALVGAGFGAAGQRCMATSVAVLVGEAREWIPDIVAKAKTLKVNAGTEPGADLGPVISRHAKERIESLIAQSEREGARIELDGRNAQIPNYPKGNFIAPTVISGVKPEHKAYQTEIFGPVLQIVSEATMDPPCDIPFAGVIVDGELPPSE